MTKPSGKYLEKVERWILGGVDINQMVMSIDQRFRAKMAYEAYQLWLQNKQIRPNDIMRRLASREYARLLHEAQEGNQIAREYVAALRIAPGKARTITEISNDVAVFNWLVGRFNTPVEHIEKAKVQDASDWLIREGMKTGDARAVKNGADIKMQLHDNFRDKEDVLDQMPTTDINITGDVSVIKPDYLNYTEEEKKRMARKYGLTDRQMTDLMQGEDGTWQIPAEAPDPEPDMDVFNSDM